MVKPAVGKSLQSEVRGDTEGFRYKRVRKMKWGKWISEIRLPDSRNRIWLGSYDSAVKAVWAFDAAQVCLRGRSARLNFPGSSPEIPCGPLIHHEIQMTAAQFANSGPASEPPSMGIFSADSFRGSLGGIMGSVRFGSDLTRFTIAFNLTRVVPNEQCWRDARGFFDGVAPREL